MGMQEDEKSKNIFSYIDYLTPAWTTYYIGSKENQKGKADVCESGKEAWQEMGSDDSSSSRTLGDTFLRSPKGLFQQIQKTNFKKWT